MLKNLPQWAWALSALAVANALTGDTQCEREMCISAVVHNNSTTQYTLTVKQAQIGWMAMGFGSSMTGSPMVVMWRDDSNGNVIVSQRQASSYSEPQVVSSPDRAATALNFRTSATSEETTFAYEIPSNTDTRQSIIWAYNWRTRPSGSSPDARLTEHDDMGSFRLNLAAALEGDDDGANEGESENDDDESEEQISDDENDEMSMTPLTSRQRMLLAHGVIMALAFLVILPIGALTARLSRTFIPGKVWFGAHWIFQWPVAGALIIIGFGLGVSAVGQVGKPHFQSTHKVWGLVLPLLWVVQCSIGGFIHFVKDPKRTRRPPQNYFHAVLGLLIIALAFWQVYTGFTVEWPRTGRPKASSSVYHAWLAWIVIVPVLYLGGLVLLPRQYRQEKNERNRSGTFQRS